MSSAISTRWALRHVFDIENLRGCSAHSSALRGLRYVRLPLIPCCIALFLHTLTSDFFQDNASMTIPFPMVWQKNTRSSYHPFFSDWTLASHLSYYEHTYFPACFIFVPFFHCRKKRWCDEKKGIGRLKRGKTNFGHCVSMVFQWKIPERTREGGKKKMCVKSCANYRSSSRSKNFTQL